MTALFYRIRGLFQLFTFICFLLVIGSLGAWETGSISFFQLLLQIALFSGLGAACAKLSRRKRFLAMHAKRRGRARRTAPERRRVAAAHAL